MEETEKTESDGKINTINGGTGAAVTVVTAQDAFFPHWIWVVGFVAMEVLGLAGAVFVLFWPRGAH